METALKLEDFYQRMASNGSDGYVLGIDIGTTSVKVALVEEGTRNVIKTNYRETNAQMRSDIGPSGNEQYPDKIVGALQFCVSGLPKDKLCRVVRIGIAGQMHGIVLWEINQGWNRRDVGRYDVKKKHTSHLYTWQDGRCSSEFISNLPKPKSHLKLATGLGCATVFWLLKNHPELLERYQCAGTIHDFIVAMLCNLEKPVMSVHNAASWGYFDTVEKSWNLDILAGHGFPVDILPEVRDPGSLAGHLPHPWYSIPEGTPVGVALGDLQCSILSRLNHPQDAVLNISTSAQLAFQKEIGFVPEACDSTSAIEYFPYFNDRFLAVAASLTGGNVMAAFVSMLQQWTHELGLGVPESTIWEKLTQLGRESAESDLVIVPTIYGERHAPNQKASVTNIHLRNINLGSVYRALCHGLIDNLHNMMPDSVLHEAEIRRILCTGTAIVKNSNILEEITAIYNVPVLLSEDSEADAALGAAIAMM